MARYIDGFLLVVPKRNIAAYRKIASRAGKVWREYGALEYVECVIEDPQQSFGRSFAKVANAKPGEAVVFSWIAYKSRAHRDAVNKKVMADPRMQIEQTRKMPFDHKKMSFAGFKAIVEL